MVLQSNELDALFEELSNHIKIDLYQANSEQRLNGYLESIHYDYLVHKYNKYYDMSRAKIVLIGDSCLSVRDIKMHVKKKGLDPNRVELILDYDKLTNFDINKFRNNANYSNIIFGAIPHKIKGIGDYKSAISMMQQESEQFPKIIIATDGHGNKITKSSLDKALEKTQMYMDIYA